MLLGILGAGQLGRMLALAAAPLGVRVRFLDHHESPCGAPFGEHVRANFDDQSALARFADGLDVCTFEFENIPARALEAVGRSVPLRPGPSSLSVAQDRLAEKQLFDQCGIAAAPTLSIETPDELCKAVEIIGAPGILKARTGGYDGKGQARVTDPDDLADAITLAQRVPCVYERFVDFEHEASIVAVRAHTGECAFYPLAVNTHERGILTKTVVPASPHPLTEQARGIAARLMEALGHVGVFTVEFFVEDNALVANEIAPRVHNSGHWTLDASATSQFENHIRAVAGLPLGPTDLTTAGGAAMLNCIGAMPDAAAVLAHEKAKLHDYAKEPRPGRKVGHANWRGAPDAAFADLASLVETSNTLAS